MEHLGLGLVVRLDLGLRPSEGEVLSRFQREGSKRSGRPAGAYRRKGYRKGAIHASSACTCTSGLFTCFWVWRWAITFNGDGECQREREWDQR